MNRFRTTTQPLFRLLNESGYSFNKNWKIFVEYELEDRVSNHLRRRSEKQPVGGARNIAEGHVRPNQGNDIAGMLRDQLENG